MLSVKKEYKDIQEDDNSSLSKNIDSFVISKNLKTKLTLEFKNFPEYIFEGDQIIINEKNFKALGTISRICQFT